MIDRSDVGIRHNLLLSFLSFWIIAGLSYIYIEAGRGEVLSENWEVPWPAHGDKDVTVLPQILCILPYFFVWWGVDSQS